MTRTVAILTLLLVLGLGVCSAEKGQIVGSVADVRSGVPVPVHPVIVAQGRDTLARTLTDRLGKFKLAFVYAAGKPLTLKTGTTSGYLEAQGTVEADTEVVMKVMPRWATILGIVTDRGTGRGLGDIPIQAGRGAKTVSETWAATKTDPTGVYMLKVPAFDGDDVAKPVRDLWLSINEGDAGSATHAAVRTDAVPLWAWPDPTEPTKVEVSLPPANATGLTVADVVAIKVPEGLVPREPVTAPPPLATPATTAPAAVAAPTARPGECFVVCPHCGKKLRVIIMPAD